MRFPDIVHSYLLTSFTSLLGVEKPDHRELGYLSSRSKAEVAADYGLTYRWVHTLVGRYLAGGWEAIEPQSRRPNPKTIALADWPKNCADDHLASPLFQLLLDCRLDEEADTLRFAPR